MWFCNSHSNHSGIFAKNLNIYSNCWTFISNSHYAKPFSRSLSISYNSGNHYLFWLESNQKSNLIFSMHSFFQWNFDWRITFHWYTWKERFTSSLLLQEPVVSLVECQYCDTSKSSLTPKWEREGERERACENIYVEYNFVKINTCFV